MNISMIVPVILGMGLAIYLLKKSIEKGVMK